MDKVRADSERPAAVLTGKAVGAKGEKDAVAVRGGRVADGDGSGFALGDGVTAAAGRAGRVQGSGIRDEKFGGVVMSDGLRDMNFRGQAGKAVSDI